MKTATILICILLIAIMIVYSATAGFDEDNILETSLTVDDSEIYLPLVVNSYQNDGNQFPNVPALPSPGDGDTSQSINVNLSWIGGDPDGDSVTYDVYFEAENSTPDQLLCTEASSTNCDPGILNYNTKYYWQVIARDEHGATSDGSVWNFTTGTAPNNPPHIPSNPSPGDGATDQSITTDLTWNGGDPDGDNVTYDVYLEVDDSSPDVLICNDASSAACDPGDLTNDTRYYWQVVSRDEHGAMTEGPVWDFTSATVQMPDLIVSDLTITSMTSDSIAYAYTIKNEGTAPANLDGPTDAEHDNVSVQAFLSDDTIFNNSGDVAAGGKILGLSPLGYLDPGETFSGSFGSSSSVDPSSMNYLILKVDWGEVVDESDETNNTLATPTSSQGSDLVVFELTVTSMTSSYITYDYIIKNIGTAPANLDGPTDAGHDNVSVQAYLSDDLIFNNSGDVPAGGSVLGLGTNPLGYLDPGETFSGSFGSSPSVDPSSMNYLILKVDWGEVVDESDETNNTLPAPIVP